MTTDTIRFEILEDGTVSIETDAISGANHHSADELLAALGDMLGGTTETKQKRGHVHKHRHAHGEHHYHH